MRTETTVKGMTRGETAPFHRIMDSWIDVGSLVVAFGNGVVDRSNCIDRIAPSFRDANVPEQFSGGDLDGVGLADSEPAMAMGGGLSGSVASS